jgi:hypothetical protein
MQSSTRKSSSSSTRKSLPSSSSKAAKQSSKLGTTTLYNIHDDVLQIMLQRLTIKQLLEIYITNTAFSDKGIILEMEVVDLSNVIITKKTLDFLDKVLDKSKIKRLILNNTRFEIKTSEQFSGNNKMFENVKELQIKDTRIDEKLIIF